MATLKTLKFTGINNGVIMLEVFLANLKGAWWDRETITVHKGEFTPEEIKQIIKEIEQLKANKGN